MNEELKQEFEQILRANGVPYYTEQAHIDILAAMLVVHQSQQTIISSLKSRVEELEKTLKTATIELEMYIPVTDVKVLDKCYAALRNKAK